MKVHFYNIRYDVNGARAVPTVLTLEIPESGFACEDGLRVWLGEHSLDMISEHTGCAVLSANFMLLPFGMSDPMVFKLTSSNGYSEQRRATCWTDLLDSLRVLELSSITKIERLA